MDRDKQEPVAHVYRIESNGRPCVAWDNTSEIKVGAKLYAAPREWVGLTDGEIDILSCETVKGNKSVNWLCKVLEAKLKEKNT
jgi:hypothetical protein